MYPLLQRTIKTCMFANDVGRRFSNSKTTPITKSDGAWLKKRVQEMGPTYIKIGQFVSARKDIFDKAIVESMAELQDTVQPVPFDQVKNTIRNLSSVVNVQETPIASASIGQVHVGRLQKRRSKIVVKVKRPGVEREINDDVRVLLTLCGIMDAVGVEHMPEITDIVKDFHDFMLQEIDFTKEVSNMKAFAASVSNNPMVVVPKLVNSMCNDDAIVMQYVPHVKFKDAKVRMTPEQRKSTAYALMDTFVSQLVKEGIVHGDPHGGNVALTPNFEKFVFYDFGNVIMLDKQLRRQMICLVFELMTDNVDGSIDVLRNMRHVSVRDEPSLRAYITKYSEYMRTVDVTVFKSLITNDKETYTKLPVKFDAIIFRIIRVFGLVEGICKDLDPTFTYTKVFSKYTETLFTDPEFIEYKIKSDTRKVLNGMLTMLM